MPFHPLRHPEKFYAKKFSPYLVFDKEEKFFPCSMKYYVANASLLIGDKVIIPAGELAYKEALEISKDPEGWRAQRQTQDKTTYPGDIQLRPRPAIIQGQHDFLTKAKIYCRLFKVTIEENGVAKELYAFKYVFTYAYDNPNTVLSFLFKKNQNPGYHESDIEHCEVLTTIAEDGLPGDIYKMYYAAHGSGEGKWYTRQALNEMGAISEDGHPYVHVAIGTHASYPKRGRVFRVLGLFNDLNEPGITWKPSVSLHCGLLKNNPGFNYGYEAVSTYQSYLDTQHNTKNYSTNKFMQTIGVLFSPTAIYDKVKSNCMTLSHTTLTSQPIHSHYFSRKNDRQSLVELPVFNRL